MFKNTKPGRWPYINFRLVINMEFELPTVCLVITVPLLDDILPKGPYPPCLRMTDRALLTGYPRTQVNDAFNITERWTHYDLFRLQLKSSSLSHCEGNPPHKDHWMHNAFQCGDGIIIKANFFLTFIYLQNIIKQIFHLQHSSFLNVPLHLLLSAGHTSN